MLNFSSAFSIFVNGYCDTYKNLSRKWQYGETEDLYGFYVRIVTAFAFSIKDVI